MNHTEFMEYLNSLDIDLKTNPLRTLEEEWA